MFSFLSCTNKQDKLNMFNSNHWNQALVWKKDIKLSFHRDFPKDKRLIVIEEVSKINNFLNQNLITFEKDSSNLYQKDGVNVLYWNGSKIFKELNPGEQARTSIYWSGDSIIESDIVFSDKFEDYDFHSLVRHEFGHLLGLKHFDNESNLMNSYLGLGEVKEFSKNQIQQLNFFYKKDNKLANF